MMKMMKYIRRFMFDLDYQIISNDCDITINEFKAIQQQLKELGWLDKDNVLKED